MKWTQNKQHELKQGLPRMLALGVIFFMPSPVTGNINANKDRGNEEHANTT